MNDQERLKRFDEELIALQKKWGVLLVADVDAEALATSTGKRIEIMPRIKPALMKDWEPSKEDDKKPDSTEENKLPDGIDAEALKAAAEALLARSNNHG